MRTLTALAVACLFALSGCAQLSSLTTATPPTDAPIPAASSRPGSPAGDNSVKIERGPEETRITCYPEKAGTQIVDYFISRVDSPDFLVHLEGNAESTGFGIEVPNGKFYRGTYSIRVHADKASTPFKITTFFFDGASFQDPGATPVVRPGEK